MSRDAIHSTLVLVPNRAIQQLVLAELFPGHLQGGTPRALAAPPVKVLSMWAGRLLERGLLLAGRSCPVQPSQLRLRRLWESAIRATDKQGLLESDIASLAREAMEAERLCENWLIPVGLRPGDAWSDEGFCHWRERVNANLEAHGWLDQAGALRELASLLESADGQSVPVPERISLRGFVERTPLELRLLRALESRGVRVEWEAREPGAEPNVVCERFPDREQEIRAAAAWARDRLDAGTERVAVAVNDFQALRPRLERAFRHTFHPAEALALATPEMPAYHLHGGSTLAHEPLVEAALDLLELSIGGMKRAQSFARISRWLLSPAWRGGDVEAAERARLELALRHSDRFQPSLAFTADRAREFDCPILLELAGRIPGRDSAPTPARRFFACLAHWGWPGPLAVGEQPGQVVDQFRKALEELEFSGSMADDVAFAELKQLCRERQLRSAGGVLSPIQVLPVENAVGGRFQALRVINLHGDNWPAPVRLNRLLPFTLNRKLPRSDMQRQFDHFLALQQELMNTSARVTFTRAEQVDGVKTSISPLVGTLAGEERSGNGSRHGLAVTVWPEAGDSASAAGRDLLTDVEREAGPGIESGTSRLKGAVGVLNLQSACPWAAFLVHRLDARFADRPAPFADAAFTGSLVHRALERLYRPHLDTDHLPTPGEVPAAVRSALESFEARDKLAPAAMEAERRRIEALLNEWLVAEQGLQLGQPHLLEQKAEASLAGFTFEIRLDRQDSVPAGSLVLDYKTSALPSMSWGDERPGELQLPLYAVVASGSPDAPVGVGLLSLRGGEMKQSIWSGTETISGKGVKRVGIAKDIPFADWDATLAAWESSLTGLLNEYRAGENAFLVHRRNALRWTGLEIILRLDSDELTEEQGVLSDEA